MAGEEEEVLALSISGYMFKQGKLSVSKIILVYYFIIQGAPESRGKNDILSFRRVKYSTTNVRTGRN